MVIKMADDSHVIDKYKSLLIHCISDTHTEYLSKGEVDELINAIPDTLQDNADRSSIIILAGDIGHPYDTNYEYFIKNVRPKYTYMIVIAGNHEYYSHQNVNHYTMSKIEAQINKLSDKYNFHFLNKSSVIIRNVKFIGCTMWGCIPSNLTTLMNSTMSNYSKIDELDSDMETIINHEHVTYIKSELSKTKYKTVVITHHSPSNDIQMDKYKNNINSCCYVCNQEDLFTDPLIAWYCGHVHTSNIHYINSIPLICNCYGYDHERESEQIYDPAQSISIV
jgi:metallophosphoesterase superfamily enzyme